jgi:TRAP-type C4-dicarboxylate transport system permease large subunit
VQGGLPHAGIVSRAVFPAIRASSVTMAAAMGPVALAWFQDTTCGRRMARGSLAAGGAPGSRVPPGIAVIIHGPITDGFLGGCLLHRRP